MEKVGVKKVGVGTGLLWKLSERKGAGETPFDKNLKGQDGVPG